MFKFGFIGTGNMGSALARAVSKKAGGNQIILFDKDESKCKALSKELGCKTGSLKSVLSESEYVFLGVKPQMLSALVNEVKATESSNKPILISMLAGTGISKINEAFGKEYKVIRIMPNIACSVGKATTLCAKNEFVTDNELSYFLDAMEFSGTIDMIDEKLIDAASAVSGCGPAYAFMMIEALADGAVKCGIPRSKAYLYAASVLEGSAKLFLESELSASELKDAVCSPGGTTIEGVRALENGRFRGTVMEAVIAAYEKTKKL